MNTAYRPRSPRLREGGADGYAGLHLTERGLALSLGQDVTATDFRRSNCAPTLWFVWPRGTLASALVQRQRPNSAASEWLRIVPAAIASR
jgi:hypothetical protein